MGIKTLVQKSLIDWLVPAIRTGHADDIVYLQRSRTVQFLFSTIIFQGIFLLAGASAAGSKYEGFIAADILMTIFLLLLSAFLCHHFRIEFARKLVLFSSSLLILFSFRVEETIKILMLVMIIPIISNIAVLSSIRSMWIFVGGLIAAFNVYQYIFIHGSHIYQWMFVGTFSILGMAMTTGYGAHRFRLSYEMFDQTIHIDQLHRDLQQHADTITDLNAQVMHSLSESELLRNTYETIFQSVQEMLIIFDLQLHIQYVNSAVEKVFPDQSLIGMALDELQNSSYALYTPDKMKVQLDDHPVTKVLQNKTLQSNAHYIVPSVDANPLILDVYAIPIVDKHHQVTSILQVMHDISEEYRSKMAITLLQNISHVCSEAVNLQSIAESTLQLLVSTLQIVHGVIFVKESAIAHRNRIIATVTIDSQHDILNKIVTEQMTSLPIEKDSPLISFRAMATGKPLFDESFTSRLRPLIDLDDIDNLRLNSIPIFFDNDLQGVLSYFYSTTKTNLSIMRPSQELMMSVVHELEVAFHRAQLYTEAQNASLFDSLTGLRNYRSLQDILQLELASSANLNLPVSLILFDINHFRKFNEEYGHDMGDLILRMIGRTINHNIRSGDYAARYSGEEFVVVLPMTDAHKAHIFATDLKFAIEQCLVFPDYDASETIALSIAAGHSTFPRDASTAASLLKAAEIAVYSAKRLENNDIVQYSLVLLQSHTRSAAGSTNAKQAISSIISLPSGAELDAVQAFVTAIDLRDGYTAAHSNGVSEYAVALATAMELPYEHVEMLRLGGLIHDVGKIGVPDSILRKPGKLTEDEWAIMKAHTTMGASILEPVEHLRHLIPLVRWHHERLDGSGYPDGLKGDEIPLLVQILAVADVFEAFTAERPYHPGRSASEGIRFLHNEVANGRMSGSLIKTFRQILEEQGILQNDDYHWEAA